MYILVNVIDNLYGPQVFKDWIGVSPEDQGDCKQSQKEEIYAMLMDVACFSRNVQEENGWTPT
ncbi:hypothetical protein D8674_025315 [Pyrus ussuriensis x Pyrus communis]|uniref:Uncharacterized protein n=1 Tax=Pyrus ussuriensis x Pyrus communis TaxID=2448454 RepID=A0A5N5H982_9ROSA|nr:hypothetical protein D8674_025315 [Pyrus ussuriensis x Pyrus communis]